MAETMAEILSPLFLPLVRQKYLSARQKTNTVTTCCFISMKSCSLVVILTTLIVHLTLCLICQGCVNCSHLEGEYACLISFNVYHNYCKIYNSMNSSIILSIPYSLQITKIASFAD